MNVESDKDNERTPDKPVSQSRPVRSISLANNRVDSRELFHGVREITVAHGDETYRLRLTAQNKLILTK
jgi:hemin uptake protein HemP